MQANRTRGRGGKAAPRAGENHVFVAKQHLRTATSLLAGRKVPDDAVQRARQVCDQAIAELNSELRHRRVREPAKYRTVDRRGRSLPEHMRAGHGLGQPSPVKGRRFPPDPPTVEETIKLLRACGNDPIGWRLRALIIVLWRAGLRISEALSLTDSDLDRESGTVFVRYGKGGRSDLVGIDDWVWPYLDPWLEHRRTLPPGPLFCIAAGPTAGQDWAATNVRAALRRLAKKAEVRKRIAPHQFRHALAVELVLEGKSTFVIMRQLRHANLQVTTVYLRSFPQLAIVAEIRQRPVPTISALQALPLAA